MHISVPLCGLAQRRNIVASWSLARFCKQNDYTLNDSDLGFTLCRVARLRALVPTKFPEK